MANNLINIFEFELSQIKSELKNSRDDIEKGNLEPINNLETKVINLSNLSKNLNKEELEPYREEVFLIIEEMKLLNNLINCELDKITTQIEEQRSVVDANIKYRINSTANDN
jgi:hypothetical protein